MAMFESRGFCPANSFNYEGKIGAYLGLVAGQIVFEKSDDMVVCMEEDFTAAFQSDSICEKLLRELIHLSNGDEMILVRAPANGACNRQNLQDAAEVIRNYPDAKIISAPNAQFLAIVREVFEPTPENPPKDPKDNPKYPNERYIEVSLWHLIECW